MEAKHYIFILASLVFIPAAVWFATLFKWAERLLVIGIVFSTAYLVDINFVSMEWYRGDTRGFEIGITDWMTVSLLIVMLASPRWQNRRFVFAAPNMNLMLVYFALCGISVFAAYVPVYSGFGITKISRAFLVYLVAYNYLRDERDLRFIILLMASIVALQFVFAVEQRFSGLYRVVGTTPHANTLAGYLNLFNMIFLALLLNKSTPYPGVCGAALAMGTLTVLATFSRGALAAMVFGYGLVTLLSFKDRLSPRKLKIVGMAIVLSLPIAIKVAPSIIDRFINAPESSSESRRLANNAALAMANDHFLGVGLNNYSHVINETDYSRFIEKSVDRGIVHNIYLLHASEIGWHGLLVFLLMIGNFLRIGFQQINKHRDNLSSAFAVGITTSMIVLWSQGLLEWVFRQTSITVAFFLLAGFLSALGRVDRENTKRAYIQSYRRHLWIQQNLASQS